MKRKMNIWLSIIITTIAAFVVAGGRACEAQDRESVILVHLQYSEGAWSVGPAGVEILPCQAPVPRKLGPSEGTTFLVLGEGGKVLYRHTIFDPRRILVEDPKEQAELLKEVSFKARFPLMKGMQRFEFWYEGEKGERPALSVNLTEAIKKYFSEGGDKQKADCQMPALVPDQLKGRLKSP